MWARRVVARARGEREREGHGVCFCDTVCCSFGSPFYMAPELLLDKDWDKSIDVYAFGITLW